MADSEEAQRAYAFALEVLHNEKRFGGGDLSLGEDALTRIPPEISQLEQVWRLVLHGEGITNVSPLSSLVGLQRLSIHCPGVTDISPLVGLAALQVLSLNRTGATDLSPLAGLHKLRRLYLNFSKAADLRPIANLSNLAANSACGLWFRDTPAAAQDKELRRISLIEDDHDRTTQTLAYLRTLPPWPEPLSWEVEAAEKDAPLSDPAFPLVPTSEGIALAAAPISAGEALDPVRLSLYGALSERVTDLIRIAGNMDEAALREACRLRDLLEPGLPDIDPLRVHLATEALRRVRAGLGDGADRDLVLAIDAVTDIGPGLTLDTKSVEIFLDRARRNRLERRSEAEEEAQIRLAESIGGSALAAPDLRDFAALIAEGGAENQFTALRPTLTKNWIVFVGSWAFAQAVGGPIGNAAYEHGLPWLVANADDILTVARYWGDPVLAWIAPILDRARHMVEAAQHIARQGRDRT